MSIFLLRRSTSTKEERANEIVISKEMFYL